MSVAELKKNKPKYSENIEGTHCMGSHWTVCCPNRHLQYERYQPTKDVIQLYYNGGIYRVFVCTKKCSKDLTTMAKSNPGQFKKLFIKMVKPNGDMILKHRDTGKVAQIAQKVDTYKQKGGSYKMFMRTRRRKHKRRCGHTLKHRRL